MHRLRYNHVILLHLNDGTLPSLRGDDSLGKTTGGDGTEGGLCRSENELEDEERRLLHVCISRAKVSCLLGTVLVSKSISATVKHCRSFACNSCSQTNR